MGKSASTSKRLRRIGLWFGGLALAAIIAGVTGALQELGKSFGRVLETWVGQSSGRQDLRLNMTEPRDLGDFPPKENKCVADPGGIVLSVLARTPGDYSGCCMDLVGSTPVDIAPGAKATVKFKLEKNDRVDFKFESGRFASTSRVEAWIVRGPLTNSTTSVTRILTSEGRTPLKDRVVGIQRFCMAIVGPDGPAQNTLRLESVSIPR